MEIPDLYRHHFERDEDLFGEYIPFGCNNRTQEIWLTRPKENLAAAIWHETHPDDYAEERWLKYPDLAGQTCPSAPADRLNPGRSSLRRRHAWRVWNRHTVPSFPSSLLFASPCTSPPRGQAHLSAASGLVRAGAWLYLVADDEHHLGLLHAAAAAQPPLPQPPRVQLHRSLQGDLPAEPGARKAAKPYLEALASPACPHGSLMALGSGSEANRQRGIAMALDAAGRPAGTAQVLDLSALYAPLRTEFADLNIEGAFVAQGRLHLLQRGNKGDARSACIRYPLAPWQAGTRSEPPPALGTTLFDLGTVDGVPLGFTDGAALADGQGWLFSAVAENTADSYADGACVASAIGWVGPDGGLQRMSRLQGAPKVEGIALDGDWLLMVTDADDPASASRLLSVALA